MQKVMPCCYSLCLRNLLIMKQLFANSEPGKRWQYTGRAKEGSGDMEPKRSLLWGLQSFSELSCRQEEVQSMGKPTQSEAPSLQKGHLSQVFKPAELHMHLHSLPDYNATWTLRLFIKTLFKFPRFQNILPDYINQYLFLTFLTNDTSYSLYHK